MIRSVYRTLLWMHPAEFEERYAGEMLWIFDLKRPSEPGVDLLIDCLASLCRQWLACYAIRTFAMGFLVSEFFALCSVVAAWFWSPRH